ncbi:MAG TPA: hypothetical protein VLZ53_06275 [Devosia sp.]|nr:hypothetical protein [Devosia sp.]
MLIENILYFALGVLLASLVALIIMPAVWKRAVRLTKRRIEAATPITMAEFRADKDQLRAEFALQTRKLEMTLDSLRARLAEQLADASQQGADLGTLNAERARHQAHVLELEQRLAQLHERTAQLERDGADLAQRLRMRERELATRTDELAQLRQSVQAGPALVETSTLSGEYDDDIARLSNVLGIERKRASFLEEQALTLLERLDQADRQSPETSAAIARMREALTSQSERRAAAVQELVAAEARMVSAENSINAILAAAADQGTPESQPLADQLDRESALEQLRQEVGEVETTILNQWDKVSPADLRHKLGDIATRVSRLVPAAADAAKPAPPLLEESLFDRVQRFAEEGDPAPAKKPAKPAPRQRRGRASERMAAMREIQVG